MAQQYGQQGAGFLFDIGQQEQKQAQAQLDAARATNLQNYYQPYQQLSFLSDIQRGAPSTQMVTSQSTSPQASPFQQFAGTAVGGLAAAAGASRAGLFG
jgi:cell shape-determining protein MreC